MRKSFSAAEPPRGICGIISRTMKYDKNHALLECSIPGIPQKSGKVRDVFDLGDKLLMVVTDRISAFDVILPCGVPDKGRVLNRLSLFWLDFLGFKEVAERIMANLRGLLCDDDR